MILLTGLTFLSVLVVSGLTLICTNGILPCHVRPRMSNGHFSLDGGVTRANRSVSREPVSHRTWVVGWIRPDMIGSPGVVSVSMSDGARSHHRHPLSRRVVGGEMLKCVKSGEMSLIRLGNVEHRHDGDACNAPATHPTRVGPQRPSWPGPSSQEVALPWPGCPFPGGASRCIVACIACIAGRIGCLQRCNDATKPACCRAEPAQPGVPAWVVRVEGPVAIAPRFSRSRQKRRTPGDRRRASPMGKSWCLCERRQPIQAAGNPPPVHETGSEAGT
jgi:hypothetical protein